VPDQAYYVIVAAVAVAAVAIAVWTFLPALRGPEAARRDVGTHRLAFGCAVTVLLMSTLLGLPFARDLRDGPFTLATFAPVALATQVPMLLVVYARLIWPHAVTWHELGLRPLPIGRVLRVGLTTGAVGLLVTITISLALTQVGLRPNQLEQFSFVRAEGRLGLIVALVIIAGTAPCVEELFFRGFLFGLYRRRQPLWVAYLVSGAIFAAAHVMPTRMDPRQAVGLAMGIFVLGTILAWTYQRTGSLYPGMAAHALNNAIGVLALYALDAR
jgi:membrane protease YdiL (CAAX protease family)